MTNENHVNICIHQPTIDLLCSSMPLCIPVFHTGIYYKHTSRRLLTSQLPASIITVLNNYSIPENLKNSISADVIDYTQKVVKKNALALAVNIINVKKNDLLTKWQTKSV